MQLILFVLQMMLQLPNDSTLTQKTDYNPSFPSILIPLASWIKALNA